MWISQLRVYAHVKFSYTHVEIASVYNQPVGFVPGWQGVIRKQMQHGLQKTDNVHVCYMCALIVFYI